MKCPAGLVHCLIVLNGIHDDSMLECLNK